MKQVESLLHEARLNSCFMPALSLTYPAILMVHATCPSEMLGEFQQMTWIYIREYRILHDHCC
jgi:hypothetical protein